MSLIALPNAPAQTSSGNDTNNFELQEGQIDKLNSYMLRVDQAWNNANHSYINLRSNHWSDIGTDPFGPQTYNGQTYLMNETTSVRNNKGITLDHTFLFNRNFLLDVNYNLTNYFVTETSPTAGMNPTALGFAASYAQQMQNPSTPIFESIVPGAEYNGLGTNYGGNYTNDVNQDLKASMTETWRNHTFRYGGELLFQQEGIGNLSDAGGEFSFGTNWTTPTPVGTTPTGSGSALASFILGLPTGGSIPTTATAFWSQHYDGVYFQDDWRVNSKLTLNLGLRWDFERPLTERYDRYVSRFDPNYVITGVTTAAQAAYATLLSGSSAANTGLALLQANRSSVSSFVAKGGLLYAGVNGTSRDVENPRYKYYQPRVGFAYQVHENTVIRGGFGRFVQADFNTGAQTGYSQTTNFTATTNSYQSAPTISMDNPYPNGLLPVTGNTQGELTNVGSQSSYTDPNIGRIYVDAASASLQQQVRNYLLEISYTLNETHGQSMAWEVNDPTAAEWHAAYDPQFTSTGAPVLTSAASTTVNNPFYDVAGIETTLSDYTSKTIGAYSLLRPNPLLGNLTENRGTGMTRYYALQSKAERRFKNGFSVLQSFTWGKLISANTFYSTQTVAAKIEHTLSGNDTKFHYIVTPVYELPFGHGKYFANHLNRPTDAIIGGWEFTGEYQFQSGTPLVLPTNSAFFQGGDPSLGSHKTSAQWFNTSMFAPYPTSSTTQAQLAAYPSWTGVQGMPGAGWTPTPGVSGYSKINNGVYNDFATLVTYNQRVFGNIRNPYITTFMLGARKNFRITESTRLQIGMDAFNALNHPQFGSIDTTPTDTYFGAIGGSLPSKWVQVNSPRTIQLRGRITF
jgi:hypothetical protein